jgi:hypothetical protein
MFERAARLQLLAMAAGEIQPRFVGSSAVSGAAGETPPSRHPDPVRKRWLCFCIPSFKGKDSRIS